MQGRMTQSGLWVASGGQGDRLVVLLHGLCATGAVWAGLTPELERRGWRWIAPDLRGHGRSVSAGPFGFGNHAADVAALLAAEPPSQVTILGHSFGGVVGALYCGGLFGPLPARLVTLGVKQAWSEAEIAGARAMALKSGKVFATESEAVERFAKTAGLSGLVGEGAPELQGGVTPVKDGFALSLNPAVFSAVGPSVEAILRGVQVPMQMAAGAEDPMVSLAEMRAIDPGAVTLPGLPHNAHVVDPVRVADLLQ